MAAAHGGGAWRGDLEPSAVCSLPAVMALHTTATAGEGPRERELGFDRYSI